jgi:valyl-tRNA synthetase
MSKSVGNIVDPQKLLKLYGAEAIRFWAATEGDLSKQDLSCSEDKIKAELKTLNKILNISKFVNLFEKPSKKPKTILPLDQLYIDYIEDLTKRTEKAYEEYDFYHPAIELRKFVWDTFASHYLELIKPRVYNADKKFSKEEENSAKYTLHFLLERMLYLLYPIVPQITSTIAEDIGINLLKSEFPESNKTTMDLSLIEQIILLNSSIWKTKKEQNLSLASPISGIKVPQMLEDFAQDLNSAHKLQ